MTGSHTGRRGGLLASAATAALLAGCAAGPAPDDGAASAPSTTAATAAPTASAATAPSPEPSAAPAGLPPVLAASAPESLVIPAIGLRSELLHLGLREDGSLEVPPEGPGSPASWYDGSPAPGERGPAVLLGHVNATGGGPGVFAGLRSLVPGDRIEVLREDWSTAVFVVDRGEQHGKDDFPTLEVYGNTEGAELRLITCDGFDPGTGEFDDNYVVHASLEA
ncbi:hypothetical protein GCM10011374_21520 [Kocuria dechangensis]|uniref:Class F sortase n=1 Tax=Kocuria dechangensis TaxID=1176249 RepID=A0A917GVH9_9MICC|nr:class F sortase [Kocuria dechangensis]GGG58394.1 hypothetical protein GCM10011374_21520 [Kocuria dechangensis]